MQDKTPREPRRPWTEEEIDYLFRHWSVQSAADIGLYLSRSEPAVIVKASRLGLPDRDRATKPKQTRERRCLMCNNKFQSTGPGNFICSTCKESDEWNSSFSDNYSFSIHPTTRR